MSKQPENPSAFPCTYEIKVFRSDGETEVEIGKELAYTQGMSLRDYFAARALPVILSDSVSWKAKDDKETIADMCARHAYGFADAMLRARQNSQS